MSPEPIAESESDAGVDRGEPADPSPKKNDHDESDFVPTTATADESRPLNGYKSSSATRGDESDGDPNVGREESPTSASDAAPPPTHRPMSFDELLEFVGECGVYQVTLMLLIGAMELVAIDSFSINFIAGKMDHWCRVTELDNRSFADQRRLAVPLDAESSTGFSRCFRYENTTLRRNGSGFEPTMADGDERRIVTCRDGWAYDRSVFSSTIVSEVSVLNFELVFIISQPNPNQS